MQLDLGWSVAWSDCRYTVFLFNDLITHDRMNLKDARSVSLYIYNQAQIVQYVKYTK